MTIARIFISYSSKDSARVDEIAVGLSQLMDDDGHRIFEIWLDKRNLIPGHDWWTSILEAIVECEVFIFMLSKNSLDSIYSMTELDYAHKRNRVIIPIILETDYQFNLNTGKDDVLHEIKNLIPSWVSNKQFLFDKGTNLFSRICESILSYQGKYPLDAPANHPAKPKTESTSSSHKRYVLACDFAEKLNFTDAEESFRTLIQDGDSDYQSESREWLTLLNAYVELMEIYEAGGATFHFKKKLLEYSKQFPKDFLREQVFDPKGFMCMLEQNQIGKIQVAAHAPSIRKIPNTLNAPVSLTWVKIPNTTYSILKYPVTNFQFLEFKSDEGYFNQELWLNTGWRERTEWKWKHPRYWHDPKWNKPNLPVVGVSWHEAFAFSRWLSRKLDEEIELPSTGDWEFSARGDSTQIYPWGDTWSPDRCNSSGEGMSSHSTSLVRQYESVGDSMFGVVDMVGNVWEWCKDLNNQKKPLKGCCWRSSVVSIDRTIYRRGVLSSNMWGFRLVRRNK